MPVYAYKCPSGHCFDVVKKLAQLDREEPCPDCGEVSSRQVVLPMVSGDYPGYVSPTTGKWVEGKRQHTEDLKRSGCRVYEKGETEAFVKDLPKRRQEAIAKDVDKAVELAARDIGLGG